jgi:hypothetical protein
MTPGQDYGRLSDTAEENSRLRRLREEMTRVGLGFETGEEKSYRMAMPCHLVVGGMPL